MVSFCGRCRDERIDVICDFRHLMNKAHVTRWPLSSLVAQSRAVAPQFIPSHLLQLHPTQITPQSHLSLLCPWLSVMSLDPCWGCRSHQEGSFINGSYMSPTESVYARLWSAGEEASSVCGLVWRVVTDAFEDDRLAKVTDQTCDWAGNWILLVWVRGAKTSEKIVVTTLNSEYVQV